MRVYVGACPGKNLNYFNHLYPRQIGIIHTPTKRMSFNPNYPLVLDNGAFTVAPGAEFPIEKFWKFLTRYRQSNATAEWIVVPDAVGDKATTISSPRSSDTAYSKNEINASTTSSIFPIYL